MCASLYSQVVIRLCGGLLLAPVHHDDCDRHGDDQTDGDHASQDPNHPPGGPLRHRLLCEGEGGGGGGGTGGREGEEKNVTEKSCTPEGIPPGGGMMEPG